MEHIIDYSNAKINQPTINIGMIGSVSNGKSSITEKLTGVKTQKHSKEQERNITIKLGYANAKLYKCPSCPQPQCYQPHSSSVMSVKCKFCDAQMELIKHVSIVDCPGHSSLMATMLNGACVMDNSILVESASNKEIAPQTKEHLIAINISGLENKIVCLNKIDLIKKEIAYEKINLLEQQLKNTVAEKSPIIPIAANYGINIDVLCEYICKYIDEPKRNFDEKLKMVIIRSFNINKQEVSYEKLEGGVIGGTIIKGVIHVNDKIYIYPGIINKNNTDTEQIWTYAPLIATVLSINSETNKLDYAIPGGLIGIKLDIDPGLTTNDNLIGNIVTIYNDTSSELDEYKIFETLMVDLELLNRELSGIEVNNLMKKDILIINSNACNQKCEIINIKKNKAILKLLEKPICVKIGDYITLSKFINNNMCIIGRIKIYDGFESIKQ